MILGLDLDGTIDECPSFFRHLSQTWLGPVYIVTFRLDQRHAEEYASKFGIRFDRLFLARSLEEKAKLIVENQIEYFFDDDTTFLKMIPKTTQVFAVRNAADVPDEFEY